MGKTIAKTISGIAFFAYWGWTSVHSLSYFLQGNYFGWEHFAVLLIPETVLGLLFFYLLWPGKDSPDISGKFISIFSILIIIVLWMVGPLQSFFTLNLDSEGIVFSSFLYSFEIVLFGGLFISIVMRKLRLLRRFVEDYSSNVKSITPKQVEEFSAFLSGFPLNIARIGFIFAFCGYLISVPQLYFFAHVPLEVAIKSIFIGLAVSPIIALLMYILARRFLAGAYGLLYSFGKIPRPKLVVSLEWKLMMLGLFTLIMAISLFLPFIWNYFEGHIYFTTLLLGCVVMIFELVLIFSMSVRAFYFDMTTPLEALKKGLQILQTGERRYHINLQTGDEFEEVIEEFNKISGATAK